MLYVRRDENGHIVAIQSEPIDGAEEFLSPADPEVTRFLSTNGSGDINLEYLTQSDNTLIRVMEDLIYLLVDKNVILFTELPPEAQHKLASRREARARMQHAKPFFVDEDELL